MKEPGVVYLADVNDERLRRVVIASANRFGRLSGRAIVAPELDGPADAVPFPWRITVDGRTYAVDILRSLPLERLIRLDGRLPAEAMNRMRVALRLMI